MSEYHNKTLELLGANTLCDRFDASTLRKWATNNDLILPAAFLEWAELNGQQILAKYSNDDWFEFNEPTILTTPQGLRGIEFHQENQGNFSKMVLLDRGDDPRVLFSWLRESPWVIHTESFSDCVFAQIFDWQYYLEFDFYDPDYKEITYTGNINLKTDRCLTILRDRFQEEVSTRYFIGNSECRDYRFLKSLKERITVSVGWLDEDDKAYIKISCQKHELAVALEAELLNVLDIVPPVFNSVTWAVNSLGTQIDRGLIEQLKYSCINRPNTSAIERLKTCHQSLALQKRVKQMGYPNFPQGNESEFAIGDREWEVVIRFQRKNKYWWCIEGIY